MKGSIPALMAVSALIGSCAPASQQDRFSGPLLEPGQIWELAPASTSQLTIPPFRLTVGERTPGAAEGYTKSVKSADSTLVHNFYRSPAEGNNHEALIAGTVMMTGTSTVSMLCTVVDPSTRPGGPYIGLYAMRFSSNLDSETVAQQQRMYLETGRLSAEARTCQLRRLK